MRLPISISLSSLPGRRSAGSSALGLFVAPMTKTFFFLSIPSINVNKEATILFSVSDVDYMMVIHLAKTRVLPSYLVTLGA